MQLTDEKYSIFLRSLCFAAEKHKYQRRKGKNPPPYINHPIKVVEILWQEGSVRDVNVLVGALLHDTIEDTDTSPEEIQLAFGEKVKNIVLEVTNDWRLSKAAMKQKIVDQAPHFSFEAKQIKLADLICNVRDIMNDPPLRWTPTRRLEYVQWAEKVVEGLKGCNEQLEICFEERVTEAKWRINQLYNEY